MATSILSPKKTIASQAAQAAVHAASADILGGYSAQQVREILIQVAGFAANLEETLIMLSERASASHAGDLVGPLYVASNTANMIGAIVEEVSGESGIKGDFMSWFCGASTSRRRAE